MKRVFSDLTRTGLTTAAVTAALLLPAQLVSRSSQTVSSPATEPVQLQEVAPMELTDTMGVAINDKNDVVGTAFGEDEVRAFLVSNRKGQLLPLPKGVPFSAAAGLNAKGEVVGIIGNEEHMRGTVWIGGKPGVLTSGKRETVATTISGSSVAAGVAFDNQRSEFRFQRLRRADTAVSALNGGFTAGAQAALAGAGLFGEPVGALDNGFSGMQWAKPGDGKSIGEFIPQAGNAAGTLVGLTLGKNGPVPGVFKSGKTGTLPTPDGIEMAVPMSANAKEVFVGAGITQDKSVKPVGWINGKTGLLPVPGDKQGLALGINDNNQVVGVIETPEGQAHAAVWSGGKVIDLNSVVDGGGVTLVQARGINNKGYVVCTGVKGNHISAFVVGPIK